MVRSCIWILSTLLLSCGPGVNTVRNSSNNSSTTPILRVQSPGRVVNAGSTSLAISFGASQPKVGNFVVVFVATSAAADTIGSVTDNYSNVYVSAGVATEANGLAAIYYTTITNTGPGLNITATHSITGKMTVGAIEFSGVQAFPYSFDLMSVSSATGTTIASNSLSVSRGNALIVTLLEASTGSTASISPSFTNWFTEYTETAGTTAAPCSVHWAVNSAPGVFGSSWSYTPSSNNAVVTVSFKGM